MTTLSHKTPIVPPVEIADPIVTATGLCVDYDGRRALDGLDIAVPRGQITAIVGPSGCGKTTFLTSLNRMTDLVDGCRVSGRVELGGQDIHAEDCDVIALRRRVGMIFQKPSPFPMSIRKNLTFPLREYGVRGVERQREIVRRVLGEVGLWEEVCDRLDTSAMALSGGQQQRLCIARALALRPEVLLLDEPCSALDPLSSGVVEDFIAELRGDYTVVIVTHNLAQARRIADYVGLFWVRDGAGRLVEFRPAEAFFEDPSLELTRAYVNGMRG
jgi:phosphate transport system ATP-binding protein